MHIGVFAVRLGRASGIVNEMRTGVMIYGWSFETCERTDWPDIDGMVQIPN